MFCGNCGKEVKDGADFCGYCGTKLKKNERKIRTSHLEQSGAESAQVLQEEIKKPVKEIRNKKVWVLISLLIVLMLGYFGYQKIIEHMITYKIENTLDMVKNGVDDVTAKQLLDEVVPSIVQNEMISNFILNNIEGEDVVDVYHAMMRYMSYEVVKVTRVESNHYQATIRIQNLNNELVLSHAFDIFRERYQTDFFGKIEQGWEDLNTDKSQLVAQMMSYAADDYYQTGDDSYWILREHVIDIQKINGEWETSLNFEVLFMNCVGLW